MTIKDVSAFIREWSTTRLSLENVRNEHFGIVPLEAMLAGRPVLACNSGGPVESIIHGVTGYLCAPIPQVGDCFTKSPHYPSH